MSLFKRLPQPSVPNTPPQRPRVERASAFRLSAAAGDPARLQLLLQPAGTNAAPEVIWFRDCASAGECAAVLVAVAVQKIDPAFLGRQALLLGTATLRGIIDAIVHAERERLAGQKEKDRERAEAHARISSYAPDKDGWFYLTLKRDSAGKPEWSIAFRGRAERERLRDWLRWQGDRFAEFLDYAAEHGAQALEKRLIDEMFETEKRVKSDRRSAGGTRPLRMWRGE